MRSLREKLNAMSAPKPAAKEPQLPLFMRETRFPLSELGGIEETCLEEIRECDPAFAGERWALPDLLLLDTETTGLSGGAGTVAFEIGAGFFEGGELIIRQYVMRNYAQEAEMLGEIANLLSGHGTLITFNGKTFDLPLLESRFILNRIPGRPTQMPHLDLLHVCRRVYKLRLGRCSLSALEEAVLGQTRTDDLPGAQVPQRFFEFLKTGEFALLEDVLRHNLDDVRSLAVLTSHVCRGFRRPAGVEHPEDVLGIGRTLLRGNRKEKARACFHLVEKSRVGAAARQHLVLSYRRDRDWEEMKAACERMIRAGQGGTFPYIELAKYYEHRTGDLEKAEEMTMGALRLALNAPPGLENEQEVETVRKRMRRLREKRARKELRT